MHPTQRAKFQEVEEAYGESFWDVVRRFARRGLSQKETAELVGYSYRGFNKLLHRTGPSDISWQPLTVRREMPPPSPKAIRAVRKRARQHWTIWLTIRGRKRPLTFWARVSGLHRHTIRKRYHHGWRGEALIAPPMTRTERGRRGIAVRHGKVRRTAA